MRNLWLLLQRNAFFLAFIALLAVSLSVLFQHNGAARSTWFSRTGSVHSKVEQQRHQWSNYLRLAEQNTSLAEENAELRARLLSMEMETGWEEDTLRGWTVHSGMLVKGPDGAPLSLSLATPGQDKAIEAGMGVLAGGARLWHCRRGRRSAQPHPHLAPRRCIMELPHPARRARGVPRLGRGGF